MVKSNFQFCNIHLSFLHNIHIYISIKDIHFERDCTIYVDTMSSTFEQKSTFRFAIIRIPSINIWSVFTQHSVNICLIAVYCLNIFSIPKAASNNSFFHFSIFFLSHSFAHIHIYTHTHTRSNHRKKIREIDELAKRKYRAEGARVKVFNLTRANSLNLHMPRREACTGFYITRIDARKVIEPEIIIRSSL